METSFHDRLSTGGGRSNIGYRVVQQQAMALSGVNEMDDFETSEDERAVGYPTLPVDGLGSRPSINSLRHVSVKNISQMITKY